MSIPVDGPVVGIVMGSDSDWPVMEPAALGAVPEAHVHLYGKESRPGRKIGHVTVQGDDVVAVRERARTAAAVLRGDEPGEESQ